MTIRVGLGKKGSVIIQARWSGFGFRNHPIPDMNSRWAHGPWRNWLVTL